MQRYGRCSIFQDGGRPPSWIFKLEILTSVPVRRPNIRHDAKFRADRSAYCGDMADFRYCQDRDVRQLDLLSAC